MPVVTKSWYGLILKQEEKCFAIANLFAVIEYAKISPAITASDINKYYTILKTRLAQAILVMIISRPD